MTQVDGGQRDKLVPVDNHPGAVDGQHSVAIAVERERQIVGAACHLLRDSLEVGRATAVVDVAAVGLVGEHIDLRAQPPEDLRRRTIRGPVGAIEQDPAAAQVQLAEANLELPQVVLQRSVQPPYATDPLRRLQRALELRLDRVLVVIVELEPVAGEQLDPVVLVGVVRRRDHGCEVQSVAANQQRGRRCREHARQQRVSARGGDPGGDRRLEHLAGLPRVPHDQHLRALLLGVRDRGPRESERQLGRQELPCAATDAVRAKKLARHQLTPVRRSRASPDGVSSCSRGSSRSSQGNRPLGDRPSAWRTAAAYGPSSVRPSCAP